MRVQQHLPRADSEEYFLIEDEERALYVVLTEPYKILQNLIVLYFP
jgi:hypothetical protein